MYEILHIDIFDIFSNFEPKYFENSRMNFKMK